ncbi:MAG: LysR family transcriptional regulator, partial [Desulfobacterales bacterium]|nr:LysR family transcriptional regulator [Desulfobacterales bacterium]
LREESLTQAARSMNLSQPAISHSLAKLRDFFNDPLFVRQGNRMKPTLRAKTAGGEIGKSLELINRVLGDRGQDDPRESSRTFVIGITNYSSLVLMPELLPVLEKLAPGIRIITQHLTLVQKTRFLENGDLDLVIGCSRIQRAGIREQSLFSDREVCVAGRSTEIPEGAIGPDNIGRYNLIRYQVSQQETTDLFHILDQQKIKFNTPFITDQEFLIPQVVIRTGYIGIVAEKIANSYRKGFPFTVYPLEGFETRFRIRQFWHLRQDTDPVHQWLRELIADIGKRIDNAETS